MFYYTILIRALQLLPAVVLLAGGEQVDLSYCGILRVYNLSNFFGHEMRTFWNGIAILLLLAGGTFFLQGINVLPGSFMTGDPQWAINGGIMIVIALGLLVWANWHK